MFSLPTILSAILGFFIGAVLFDYNYKTELEDLSNPQLANYRASKICSGLVFIIFGFLLTVGVFISGADDWAALLTSFPMPQSLWIVWFLVGAQLGIWGTSAYTAARK